MTSIIAWCTKLRQMLEIAPREVDVPLKYRRAFRFFRGVKPVNVVLKPCGGFHAVEPGGVDTKLPGLTGELTRVFHPLNLNVTTGGAATGGARRGMTVDDEIAKIVNKGEVGDTIHQYTSKTISELMAMNLRPFMCQVPVGSIDMNIATALDIVCVDEADAEGGIVNVQLKTGFEKNYNKTDGSFFQSPFHDDPEFNKIPDTHHSRHMLQVCAEHLIVQTVYDNPLSYSMLMLISLNRHLTFCVGKGEKPPIPPKTIFMNLKKRNSTNALDNELDAVRRKHAVKTIMKKRHKLGNHRN